MTEIDSTIDSSDAPPTTTGGPDDHRPVLRPAGWRQVNFWWVALITVVTFYVAYFTKRTLDAHHGLGTSSYDFGLYDQGLWLMSRFHAPFVTLMGRNLMGDHTSFILVFLVPLYWLFPAAGTLFFAQSLALGLGAVPVFLYARQRLASEWMAFVLATAYLLHPAIGWTNVENFHPDSFVAVLVGFAIWAALTRRWRAYVVFVVLALLVKEDVSLVIVPLGTWVAIKRDRRIGLLTIAGSLGFMFVAMLVVMRSLTGVATRNAWRIPFGGPFGFLGRLFTHPLDVVDHVTSDDRPWYVWQMLAPFALVFLRRPSVAAIGSVVLAANIISTFTYQYDIKYHYSLIIVPPLAMGTVYAAAAFRPRFKGVAVGAVGVAALLTAYLWGPMPFSRAEVGYWSPDNAVAAAFRAIAAGIPKDAVVSAYYSATPHLDHRVEIYQFPNPFRIVLYGNDTSQEGGRLEDRAELVEYVLMPKSRDAPAEADLLSIVSAFDLVASNDYWELYHRSARPLPPPPSRS